MKRRTVCFIFKLMDRESGSSHGWSISACFLGLWIMMFSKKSLWSQKHKSDLLFFWVLTRNGIPMRASWAFVWFERCVRGAEPDSSSDERSQVTWNQLEEFGKKKYVEWSYKQERMVCRHHVIFVFADIRHQSFFYWFHSHQPLRYNGNI